MQSERKIVQPKANDVRRKSANNFSSNQNNMVLPEAQKFDSFGKSKHIDIPQQEAVDWQNQSFGDSVDNKLFESKRMVDVNIDEIASDNEAQNFSFCESDNKTQPRTSGIGNADPNNLTNYDPGMVDELNLFSENVQNDRFNIEQLLKRPTSVIVPSYIDTCKIISNC